MYATRLMLVELIRVVAERLTHLVLHGFEPGDIHLQTNIHSFAGETKFLYDVAKDLGWVAGEYDGTVWIHSPGIHSRTVIYI